MFIPQIYRQRDILKTERTFRILCWSTFASVVMSYKANSHLNFILMLLQLKSMLFNMYTYIYFYCTFYENIHLLLLIMK